MNSSQDERNHRKADIYAQCESDSRQQAHRRREDKPDYRRLVVIFHNLPLLRLFKPLKRFKDILSEVNGFRVFFPDFPGNSGFYS